MNKKLIVILAITLVAIIAAAMVIFYFLSLRTVTFVITPDNLNIAIYKQDTDEELGTFDSNGGTLQLQDGDYKIIPSSDRYSAVHIGFSVAGQDTTITINPDFSAEYREEIRTSEQAAINQAIEQAHPNTTTEFTINDGTIYKQGEWYATTLTQNQPGPGQLGDVYRVVLKKEADGWQLKTVPEIVLSAYDYPDIPRDILTEINAERP